MQWHYLGGKHPRFREPALGFRWSAAVDNHSFWHRQFEELALIILTKAGRLTDVVTGEAPMENKSGGAAGRDNHPELDRKRRKTTKKPRIEQTTKVHRESNGVYTHNRRGVALSADFQSGNCASTTRISYPRASGRVYTPFDSRCTLVVCSTLGFWVVFLLFRSGSG